MLGRKVQIPDSPTRIVSGAPPLQVLLYALARDTMVNLNLGFQTSQRAMIDARVADLPVIGSAFGSGRLINPEVVLNLKPDLILAWANATVDVAKVEESLGKTGLPVLFVKLDNLRDRHAGIEFVGRVLKREPRARELATYVRDALQRVDTALGALPERDRVRVYYAESPDGLATDCHKSFHTEAIELARGYNVYRCEQRDHVGMERVSMEQILAFDPQIILVQDPAFMDTVQSDPRWKLVRAVRDGRVVLIPRVPFNWLDRPPSLARALGIQWLAQMFYPDRFTFHTKMKVRRFYQLVYGIDLSDTDLQALLRPAPARDGKPDTAVHSRH